MNFILAIICLSFGQIYGFVIFLIFGLLGLLYAYLVRERIRFSAVILTLVVEIIKMFPATVYYAYASVFVQAAWMVVWVIAAGCALHSLENSGASNNQAGLVYFFFLVSFYWTSQVITNVIHVTVAGLVATWYFLFPANMPSDPTRKAFKRATWTSFGSICLGSFLVAIIKAARQMVRSLRRQHRGERNLPEALCLCFVECALSILDRLVEYFNIYAYTQIAIYGKPYCEAASDTWALFKARGIDAIINDDLIGGVLFFGSLISGLFTAAVGAVCAKYVLIENAWGLWAGIGFLVGFAMTMVVMEVIASAVCALFVCWAEDPEVLQNTKHDVYARFMNAIQTRYPDFHYGTAATV